MELGTRLRYRAAQKLGKNNHRLDLEQPIISFSFDDFPKSAAATGAKLLEERGARGSFYACADFAGREVNGIQQFDHEDIVGLWQRGHEIGCHTAGHRAVSGLSSEELKGEFDRNDSSPSGDWHGFHSAGSGAFRPCSSDSYGEDGRLAVKAGSHFCPSVHFCLEGGSQSLRYPYLTCHPKEVFIRLQVHPQPLCILRDLHSSCPLMNYYQTSPLGSQKMH